MKIKALLSRRRFLDLLTDAVNDLSGSIDIANDTTDCFADLAQVRRLHPQKILGRTGVVARTGDRLRDFVRQRGSQFSHNADAVHVSEIRLELAACLVCPPALSNVASHAIYLLKPHRLVTPRKAVKLGAG